MARRRHRKRPGQKGVQIVQIVGLGIILVVILLFRDKFSLSAGAMMDALGSTSEDVKVSDDTPPDGNTSTEAHPNEALPAEASKVEGSEVAPAPEQ